ncbi:MAG: LapA family protein [candidate division Zixibacteria bacterium]|nr:LapA family protein [candidate division Zixibacteria bacterium]
MWIIKYLLIIILIGLLVGFVVYNSSQQVTIDFFGKQYLEVRMISVIFFSFLIGMLVTFVLVVFFVMRTQAELRNQRRDNKKLLEEITALRNMPLEDTDEKTDSNL